jgi:hypothetical protein
MADQTDVKNPPTPQQEKPKPSPLPGVDAQDEEFNALGAQMTTEQLNPDPLSEVEAQQGDAAPPSDAKTKAYKTDVRGGGGA